MIASLQRHGLSGLYVTNDSLLFSSWRLPVGLLIPGIGDLSFCVISALTAFSETRNSCCTHNVSRMVTLIHNSSHDGHTEWQADTRYPSCDLTNSIKRLQEQHHT